MCFAIVILDLSNGKGFQLHLNIKVRDLREILLYTTIVKNSLKNFAGTTACADPAPEGAFVALASI